MGFLLRPSQVLINAEKNRNSEKYLRVRLFLAKFLGEHQP